MQMKNLNTVFNVTPLSTHGCSELKELLHVLQSIHTQHMESNLHKRPNIVNTHIL